MKKTTQELLQLMQSECDYNSYLDRNRESLKGSTMRIDRALNVMLAEKHLKRADVIQKSGIEKHYAYQIFSGTKKPTRDKVLELCFGMDLTIEETQDLLKITGYAQLYSKDPRDNAILFGLLHHRSVLDMNITLADLDLPIME